MSLWECSLRELAVKAWSKTMITKLILSVAFISRCKTWVVKIKCKLKVAPIKNIANSYYKYKLQFDCIDK
jgi:hypothetical protein